MVTRTSWAEKFQQVFTEPQTAMLVAAFEESRDRLATLEDFSQLKDSINRVAVAQEKTERELRALAEAHKEMSEAHKEMAEAQKEMSEAQKGMAEAQKGMAEAQKGMAEAQKEMAEAQKETAWSMKDLRKQVGGLSQSVGYGLEAYAMERIPKILAKRLGLVEESSGPEQFVYTDGTEDEIDVVVRGTISGRRVVFLCETKTNITPQEIRDFLLVADRVRPQVGCDDVHTLCFAYRASPESRQLVADSGGILAFPHDIVVGGI
jgi:membrane fusion protein (multidrug efflux system)